MERKRRPWEFMSSSVLAVAVMVASCQPDVVERRVPDDDGVPGVDVEIDSPGEIAPGDG